MIANNASEGNLNLSYRPGVPRVYVLATDEDSDLPVFSSNRVPGQTSSSECSSGLLTEPYQREVDLVAALFQEIKPRLFMFVSASNVCGTRYQLCNPGAQVQLANFSNFDADVTYSNLVALNQERSLQGQLLNAGLTARCFDVVDSRDADALSNFFESIISDVSLCDPCFDYLCSPQGQCLTPVDVCDCAGVRNGQSVRDFLGVCCLESDQDCNGVCFGTSSEEDCFGREFPFFFFFFFFLLRFKASF